MQQNNKIKISQKEFDDLYEVEEITEETEVKTEEPIPDKQDTTPEFLTEEEEEHDKHLAESLNWDEEIEDGI